VKPSVALIGKMGVGKTTIAEQLVTRFGYARFSWAAPVKVIAGWAYGPVDKAGLYPVRVNNQLLTRTGREILQRIGTDALRNNVDQDFWIKVGLRVLDGYPDTAMVGDDTRFPNEVQALRERGWVIVRLKLTEQERIYRITGDKRTKSLPNQDHPSETALDGIVPDIDIWNTARPNEVANELVGRLAQIAERGW